SPEPTERWQLTSSPPRWTDNSPTARPGQSRSPPDSPAPKPRPSKTKPPRADLDATPKPRHRRREHAGSAASNSPSPNVNCAQPAGGHPQQDRRRPGQSGQLGASGDAG